MVYSTIQVVVRTRPTEELYPSNIKFSADNQTILIKPTTGDVDTASGAQELVLKFNYVLKDTSQDQVFDIIASDIVTSAISGINSTILAYGPTAAGKTYTMMGGNDYNSRGICARAITRVFEEVAKRTDHLYQIGVTFIEIYNERVKDLLRPECDGNFSIIEDERGIIVVNGVPIRPCNKEETALQQLFEGNMNRTVVDHVTNKMSSRSHVLFTIHIESHSLVESKSSSIVSKLNLFDLAGSERLSATKSTGRTIIEAQYINKSLAFFEQVVLNLNNSTSRTFVPFRQSKLTFLMRDSLGGNCQTTMIANIYPDDCNSSGTLSTLRFATRMMQVKSHVSINLITDSDTQIKQLQQTITELKAELQMQNQLVGRSHISYDDELAEDERAEMEKTVKKYLAGNTSELDVKSLRDVKEYFKIFKGFADQEAITASTKMKGGGGGSGTLGYKMSKESIGGGSGSAGSSASSARRVSPLGVSFVGSGVGGGGGTLEDGHPGATSIGVIDKQTGVAIGSAAPCDNLNELIKRSPQDKKKEVGGSKAFSPSSTAGKNMLGLSTVLKRDLVAGPLNSALGEAVGENAGTLRTGDSGVLDPDGQSRSTFVAPPISREEAFLQFRKGVGAKTLKKIKEDEGKLLALKERLVELVNNVNSSKKDIDRLTLRWERIIADKTIRGEYDQENENEEILFQNDAGDSSSSLSDRKKLEKEIDNAKLAYKIAFEALTHGKWGRDQLLQEQETNRQQLLCDFNRWYDVLFPASTKEEDFYQASDITTTNADAIASAPFTSPFSLSMTGGAEESSNGPTRLRRGTVMVNGEVLDEGELFERLQMNRLKDANPAALTFYNVKRLVQRKRRK